MSEDTTENRTPAARVSSEPGASEGTAAGSIIQPAEASLYRPLPQVRDVLDQHSHREIPLQGRDELKRAAVAAVLREGRSGDSEVLLIHRAEHPDDPWSGHMALPGGRLDPGDAGPLDAALRETHEEVGLELTSNAERIGSLSHLEAVARGGRIPLVIVPYVFALRAPVDLEHDTREVQDTLWLPLSHLLDTSNRDTMHWEYQGMSLQLPCYRLGGRRVLWGLTLRMLDELIDLLA